LEQPEHDGWVAFIGLTQPYERKGLMQPELYKLFTKGKILTNYPMPSTTTSTYPLDQWFSTDSQLHSLYPEPIQLLASRHWTPLSIAQMVVPFLAPHPGVKVLDIGSGVGKFCLAGAYYKSYASFFGVEQRKDLVAHAEKARNILGLQNVRFIHSNITQLDFKQYDHFYFFNSFYENLMVTDKIDNSIAHSPHLYTYYHRQLYKKLEEMPEGTRVATFHCLDDKMPPDYYLVDSKVCTLLKFWMKI
jgi:SAM-dependent methyltransferase